MFWLFNNNLCCAFLFITLGYRRAVWQNLYTVYKSKCMDLVLVCQNKGMQMFLGSSKRLSLCHLTTYFVCKKYILPKFATIRYLFYYVCCWISCSKFSVVGECNWFSSFIRKALDVFTASKSKFQT